MNWENWMPRERANLCFIRRDGEVLLIQKKRGLGAGKVNAPGGKIEPGETAEAAAIRETREEVRVTPISPRKHGELRFQFADGYSLHCTVFIADGCEGEPCETDEATPFWVPEDAIPYERMWADDVEWLPQLLEGQNLQGDFTFDGDRLLSGNVVIVDGFRDGIEGMQ
jgi:8-oxo-dGTP diphosphatase